MPEAIFIPFIVFGFVAIIVKMSLDHAKWKRGQVGTASGDRSLTTSELRDLIDKSVREATLQLSDRLARLERAAEPEIGDDVSGQVYESGAVRDKGKTRS